MIEKRYSVPAFNVINFVSRKRTVISPQLSPVGDTWIHGVGPEGKQAKTGLCLLCPVSEKARKTGCSGACGNGVIIALHLPKYGRITPH